MYVLFIIDNDYVIIFLLGVKGFYEGMIILFM